MFMVDICHHKTIALILQKRKLRLRKLKRVAVTKLASQMDPLSAPWVLLLL